MSVNMEKHFSTTQLLRYTIPTISMVMFTSMYYIVDGLFVSNFAGSTAFAAVSFALSVVMILGSTGFMVGSGGSAIISKIRGEGDPKRADEVFTLLTIFAFVVGVVLALVGLFIMEPALNALGAEGEMLDQAVLYGLLSMISLPFYALQSMFQAIFPASGKPKFGLLVVVLAGGTNIVLDAIMVGGCGLGVAGAAIATVISEVVGGTIPIIYFARKNGSCLRLCRTRLDLRIIGKTCVNGSSEMMACISEAVVSMVYNYQLLIYLGEDGVAAFGMISEVALIFLAVFLGYSTGSAPLMSFQYGAKNQEEMRSLLKRGLAIICVSGVAMFLIAQILSGPLSILYMGYNEGLVQLTQHAFCVYALSFLLMGISIYGSSLFTALNNGLVSAAISFVRTLVFEVAAVMLLPLFFGAEGIWFSVIVAEVASVILTVILFLAFRKRYGL